MSSHVAELSLVIKDLVDSVTKDGHVDEHDIVVFDNLVSGLKSYLRQVKEYLAGRLPNLPKLGIVP